MRDARPADIPAMIRILLLCPEAGRWTKEDLRPGATATRARLVAELDGRVVGFLLAECALQDEAEILTLAVEPSARRQGAGRALVRVFLDCRQGEVFLEVRRSNLAAQRLYEACGFVVAGSRSGYYRTPPEDALVMRWRL